ncbi:MAG: TetR family transcriptional regulator, partial [Holophagales bacterium]|nr:TetR family transcriptional regulator [Holophagales bacterium]
RLQAHAPAALPGSDETPEGARKIETPGRRAEPTTIDTTAALDEGDTKERPIAAGIEIFARRGFADASVRSTCAEARLNPAALSYHFGGKAPFYAEVRATYHLRAVARRPIPRLDDDPRHPEKVLGLPGTTQPRPSPARSTQGGPSGDAPQARKACPDRAGLS